MAGYMPTMVPGGWRKRKARCIEILGKPVCSTATHEGDPNMVRCYVGPSCQPGFQNIDLVNVSEGIFRPYMRNGKLVEEEQWFKLG